MAEIFIPRSKLIDCSLTIRDNVERENLTLQEHSELVVIMGTIIMDHMLPELGLMLKRDVHVEADSALQQHQTERAAYPSAEFTGHFADIRISEMQRPAYLEGLGEFTAEQLDVMLVFRQKIINPDPVELGYSDEIIVPMSEAERLRAS